MMIDEKISPVYITAMKPAIGYVRLDTAAQTDCGPSIEAQRRKLAALAELHDYRVVDMVEETADARRLSRPGWSRVQRAVRKEKIGAVLIASLDRITRSVVDLSRLVADFERRGVALVSAAEFLDTTSASGRLVVNILGIVAEWEREATSDRTSAALKELKAQGRATGGVAPFGYRFERGLRVRDFDEAAILAALAEYRHQGKSWAEVARALNEAGYRTRTGRAWTRQGVYQLPRGAMILFDHEHGEHTYMSATKWEGKRRYGTPVADVRCLEGDIAVIDDKLVHFRNDHRQPLLGG